MIDAEELESLAASVACAVATGFKSRDELLELALDMALDGGADPDDRPQVIAIVDEAISAHASAQRSWPDTTDCDRLDAAFEELNARGVMARHDWSCCSNCGHAEMPDEYERVIRTDPTPLIRGYTFYNAQTTESAAEGAGLFLAFGSADPEGQAKIAREVVEVLVANGLAATWDGNVERAIKVPLVWQRRARPPRWCG